MRVRPTAVAVLAVVALSLGLIGPSGASASSDVKRKKAVDARIGALRADLDDISAALAKAAAALQAAEAQLADAQQRVAVFRGQLVAAQARERQLAEQLRVALAEVGRAQRSIDATVRKMDEAHAKLGRMASASYQSGDSGTLGVVLDAQSPGDVADRVVLARSAMQSQTAIIDDLANARADLAALRATLDAKRAQVEGMKKQQEAVVSRTYALTTAAVAAERDVSALTSARARAMSVIRAEKLAEQHRLALAQAQSRALAKRIAIAAAAAARRARLTGRPSGSGSLAWPAGGSLHGGVGERTNPYTGGLSCHAGIDIGAGNGDPVRAAATGVVVATTYNDWDGNVAIVAHGGGMTTWYAHLSSFSVSPGQRVARGQLVGQAGATGFATGPHLHFNVAINDTAWDPMGWFGGPMRTVGSLCHPPYPQPTL